MGGYEDNGGNSSSQDSGDNIDAGGGWSPNDWIPNDGNNNGPGTVTTGVFDNGTVTKGPDQWGGFWNGIGGAVGKVLDYSIIRDAARNNIVTGKTAGGQIIYGPGKQQPITGQLNINTLLIGGAVLFAVVLATKKG